MRLVIVWVIAFGAYLVLAGDASATELAAGAGVASLVALFALALHRTAARKLWLRPGPLGAEALAALRTVPSDTAGVARVLFAAALRRPAGEVGCLVREAADPGNGVRAVRTLGRSLAPDGYVVRTETDALFLHRLYGR